MEWESMELVMELRVIAFMTSQMTIQRLFMDEHLVPYLANTMDCYIVVMLFVPMAKNSINVVDMLQQGMVYISIT